MNGFVWTSDRPLTALGDARFSTGVTVPLANNALSSDTKGEISGGAGLGDIYFQPIILGWNTSRADLKVIAGVLAPTGRFKAGAKDNVGNGYWTPVIASGQTFYLSADRATTLSLFEMYEFRTTQSGTHIRPGETLDLDYSLMRAFQYAGSRLQVGLIGYGAWQTTARTGPGVTPEQEAQRYRINAVGAGMNLAIPARKLTLGLKAFDEFSNRWTYQGYSLQASVAAAF
jgi:hypothetical protein